EHAQGAYRGLHARNGRAHLRHTQGQVPEGCGDDLRMFGPRQDHDVNVCPGLDPAFQGVAKHSLDGDVAVDPWQYRRAWRRHERASRTLEYSGSDRHRADVEPDPRISQHPDGAGSRLRHLYQLTRVQAASAQPDELLAELFEVLRLVPEGDVGVGSDTRKRLRISLSAKARPAGLRHPAGVRDDGSGAD